MKTKRFTPVKQIIFLLLIAISAPALLPAQGWQWGRNLGGTSIDGATAVTTDASGNIYTTGFFASDTCHASGQMLFNTIPGGPFNSNEEIFIAKYNSSGALQWIQSAGGADTDRSQAIDIDGQGNVYIAGYFRDSVTFDGTNYLGLNTGTRRMFVAKYSASGTFQWAHWANAATNNGMEAMDLVVDDAGHAYVCGQMGADGDFEGTIVPTFGGSTNGYIAKYSPNGDLIYVKRVSNVGAGIMQLALNDAQDSLYAVGQFYGTASFEEGTSLSVTSPHGLNTSHHSYFLAAYDSAGTGVWATSFDEVPPVGTGVDVEIENLLRDSQGNFYLGGVLRGELDFGGSTLATPDNNGNPHDDLFIVQFSPGGAFSWAKLYGRPDESEKCGGFTIDPSGNLYMSGFYEDELQLGTTTLPFGSPSFFLTRLDQQGNVQWAFGDQQMRTNSNAISAHATDAVTVVGEFNSFVTWSGLNINSYGLSDAFFLRYGSSGTSIEDFQNAQSLQLFPNPATTEFQVIAQDKVLKQAQLRVYDLAGRLKTEQLVSGKVIHVDVMDWPKGTYVVEVRDGKQKFARKLIVE